MISKTLSALVLLVVTDVVGALATWASRMRLRRAPLAPLHRPRAPWLLTGALFLALMVALSAAMDSQTGAAGLGFLGYIVLSIATLWKPAMDYSPAGLLSAPTTLVMGETATLGWPVATTVALTLMCVVAAVLVSVRREL